MAAVTITLTDVCAGSNHLTFGVTGDKTGTVRSLLDDMVSPVTQDELDAFVKILARLAKIGKTNVQVRNQFQAGVTITV